MLGVTRVNRQREKRQRYDSETDGRREPVKRKKESSDGCCDSRYQKPFRPTVLLRAGKHAKHDDDASENCDQTDKSVNDRIDLQDHRVPMTSVSTRNVTFRCKYSTIAIKRRPGIRLSFVRSSVYCATQPPSTTSEVPTVNFASSEHRYRTAAAISLVTPDRPTGIIDVI